MPVTGVVVVFKDEVQIEPTLRALAAREGFTVGDAGVRDRVPVVVEHAPGRAGRDAIHWIESQPGVAMVEITFTEIAHDTEPRADRAGAKGVE